VRTWPLTETHGVALSALARVVNTEFRELAGDLIHRRCIVVASRFVGSDVEIHGARDMRPQRWRNQRGAAGGRYSRGRIAFRSATGSWRTGRDEGARTAVLFVTHVRFGLSFLLRYRFLRVCSADAIPMMSGLPHVGPEGHLQVHVAAVSFLVHDGKPFCKGLRR
jgi:hypothetical protein